MRGGGCDGRSEGGWSAKAHAGTKAQAAHVRCAAGARHTAESSSARLTNFDQSLAHDLAGAGAVGDGVIKHVLAAVPGLRRVDEAAVALRCHSAAKLGRDLAARGHFNAQQVLGHVDVGHALEQAVGRRNNERRVLGSLVLGTVRQLGRVVDGGCGGGKGRGSEGHTRAWAQAVTEEGMAWRILSAHVQRGALQHADTHRR